MRKGMFRAIGVISFWLAAIPSLGQVSTPPHTTTFVAFCEDSSVTNPFQQAIYIQFKWMGNYDSRDRCGYQWTMSTYHGVPNTIVGTLMNLWVAMPINSGQLVAGSGEVLVFVNDLATALSCNIVTEGQPNSTSDVVCHDTTHRVRVKAGDMLSVGISLEPGTSSWGAIRVAFDRQ